MDIETDFHHFYLKFVKAGQIASDEETPVSASTKKSELVYEIRQVRHLWRNRISFSTMKEKQIERWRWVIHKRIAKYFRLYTSILNFSMYILVSHRNMISVYDMSKEQQEGDYDRTEFENID